MHNRNVIYVVIVTESAILMGVTAVTDLVGRVHHSGQSPEEIGVGLQQRSVTGSKARKENPPYTTAIREFAGGGSISVLQIRDLAAA